MKPLESSIESVVCRWADRHGLEHVKLTPAGRSGYQDRLFFIPGGRPFLLELKRPGERPGKLQAYRRAKLKAKGYDAEWTDNAKTAIRWLDERLSEATAP